MPKITNIRVGKKAPSGHLNQLTEKPKNLPECL